VVEIQGKGWRKHAMREQGYTGLCSYRLSASSFDPARFFGLFWPKCDGTRISQLGQQADLFPNGTLAVGPCGYLRHFLYVYHASPRA
jgi:hypothetical protein